MWAGGYHYTIILPQHTELSMCSVKIMEIMAKVGAPPSPTSDFAYGSINYCVCLINQANNFMQVQCTTLVYCYYILFSRRASV